MYVYVYVYIYVYIYIQILALDLYREGVKGSRRRANIHTNIRVCICSGVGG